MPRCCLLLSCVLFLSGVSVSGSFATGTETFVVQSSDTEKVRSLITDRKYTEAEQLGKTLVEKNPNDAEANYQLGRAIFFQDRYAEALPYFEKVAAALPTFTGAPKYIGDCYFGLEKYDKAEEAYAKAIALDPKDAGYVLDRARTLAKLGKSADADALFRKSMSMSPNGLSAQYEYTVFLMDQKRYFEAEGILSRVLVADEKSAYGWSLMGDLLRKQKSFTRSEEAYNRALDIDPKRLRALDGLSRVLMDQELWKDAENATRPLIDADPTNVKSYLRLANVIDEQKRYTESEVIYKKLMADYPRYGEPFIDYAVSLWRQDKNKEADAQFKLGIAADPKSAWAHYTYGNFLRHQKKLKDAKAAYEEALKVDPDYAIARERLELLKLEIG